nr:MAG TPA: hypothetical protein [Caudoviricetes sp.]
MRRILINSDNVSGVSSLFAIPLDEFNRLALVDGECCISIKSYDRIIDLPIVDEKRFKVAVDTYRDKGSILHEVKITGYIPRLDVPSCVMSELQYGEWIVMWVDCNGVAKVAGERMSPMRFTSTESTEDAGYSFQFSCFQHVSPSPVMPEMIVE